MLSKVLYAKSYERVCNLRCLQCNTFIHGSTYFYVQIIQIEVDCLLDRESQIRIDYYETYVNFPYMQMK